MPVPNAPEQRNGGQGRGLRWRTRSGDRVQEPEAVCPDLSHVGVPPGTAGRQAPFFDPMIVALVPVRLRHLLKPIRCYGGEGVQRRTQCLGEKLDPVEVAYGSQNVCAVGALTTARLQKPGLPGSVEHASEQALAGFMVKQAGAELAQDAVVEARVGQVQGQKVLPVDPRPNRIGRLPVGKALAELHQRDQGQPPRRVGRLAG